MNVGRQPTNEHGTGYQRELERLASSPLGVETSTTLFDPPFLLLDGPSFVPQYEEIFLAEAYDFPFDGEQPTIVDGGANVGVATLWWRSRWPQARIVAFEADPRAFEVLSSNLRHHHGLELHQVALSTGAGTATFLSEGTDAGRLGHAPSLHGSPITVPTIGLATVLRRLGAVDLLKLDIEGAETAVLQAAVGDLHRVALIFVEYHSFAGQHQVLADLLTLLRAAGFRVHIQTPIRHPRPFRGVPADRGIDLQCNIFCWRDEERVLAERS